MALKLFKSGTPGFCGTIPTEHVGLPKEPVGTDKEPVVPSGNEKHRKSALGKTPMVWILTLVQPVACQALTDHTVRSTPPTPLAQASQHRKQPPVWTPQPPQDFRYAMDLSVSDTSYLPLLSTRAPVPSSPGQPLVVHHLFHPPSQKVSKRMWSPIALLSLHIVPNSAVNHNHTIHVVWAAVVTTTGPLPTLTVALLRSLSGSENMPSKALVWPTSSQGDILLQLLL